MANTFRTDMADELRRRHPEVLPGVRCDEKNLFELPVFSVEVLDAQGEAALGKPRGMYHTLRLPRWFDRGAEEFENAVLALAELVRRCLPDKREEVLVAALGNPDITPDALGSLAAGAILVTRHLKVREPEHFSGFCSLALCRPGVLGTSGIESAEQIATLCKTLHPQIVIAVDALAGSEAELLCRTVQVSNAGISPGSGVGNDRKELSAATLGVPVISVGIPTVIDAAALGVQGADTMFVTPRDVDRLVRAGGRLIGYALDLALHPGIDIGDIDALLG